MRDAVLILCNYIREFWGRQTGVFYPDFAVSVAKEEYFHTVFPVLLALGVILLYLLYEFVKERNFSIHMIIFLTGIFFAASIKMELLILPTFMVCLFFCSLCRVSRKQLQKTGESRMASLLILVFACLISWIVIGNSSIPSTLRAKEAKFLEELRYETGKTDLLPDGDFSKLGSKSLIDEPALEVVMSEPESYYLRGFAGTTYTGQGFLVSTNEETYDFQSLKYRLSAQGFLPETQISDVNQQISGNENENQMKIQIRKASSKYLYTPYELSTDLSKEPSVKEMAGLSYVSKKFFGIKSYGFQTVNNLTGDYLSLAKSYEENRNRISQEYRIAESYYNLNCYMNNLELPEKIRILFEEELGSYKTVDNEHFPYYKARENIMEYLNQNIEYDTSVSKMTSNEDFIERFLQTTKRGYDVHYAAAATMMYRYYGIPARYVEGYLITPEEAKLAKPYEPIEISSKNAHAWTEIYQDGIGWVPVEVTSPYLTIMEHPSDMTLSVGTSTGETEDENITQKVKPDKQKENHEVKKPQYLTVLAVMGLAAAILIFGMFIFVLIFILRKKWKKKKALMDSFCLSDRSKAVCNLFRNSRQAFHELPAVVEKAAFSRQDVSEEEYQEFYQICMQYLKTVK